MENTDLKTFPELVMTIIADLDWEKHHFSFNTEPKTAPFTTVVADSTILNHGRV